MTIKTVSAGKGVTWITDAIQLILKNPGPFVLMGLIFAIIAVVPILGSLALAIISPTLYGGIAWAARAQARGEPVEVSQLFQGFKQEGRIGPLLVLCLPGVVIGVGLGLLLTIILLIAVAGAGAAAALESPEAIIGSLGVGALILFIVAIPLLLLAVALTFFAVPDVMFGRDDAFAAIKDSLRASLANIGAFLLYLVVFFLGAIVLMLVLSLVSSFLGSFLVSVAAAPVAGASMYLAWKDIYEEPAAQLPSPASEEPPQDGGGIVA